MFLYIFLYSPYHLSENQVFSQYIVVHVFSTCTDVILVLPVLPGIPGIPAGGINAQRMCEFDPEAQKNMTTMTGTPMYMAPETFKKNSYTKVRKSLIHLISLTLSL